MHRVNTHQKLQKSRRLTINMMLRNIAARKHDECMQSTRQTTVRVP